MPRIEAPWGAAQSLPAIRGVCTLVASRCCEEHHSPSARRGERGAAESEPKRESPTVACKRQRLRRVLAEGGKSSSIREKNLVLSVIQHREFQRLQPTTTTLSALQLHPSQPPHAPHHAPSRTRRPSRRQASGDRALPSVASREDPSRYRTPCVSDSHDTASVRRRFP